MLRVGVGVLGVLDAYAGSIIDGDAVGRRGDILGMVAVPIRGFAGRDLHGVAGIGSRVAFRRSSLLQSQILGGVGCGQIAGQRRIPRVDLEAAAGEGGNHCITIEEREGRAGQGFPRVVHLVHRHFIVLRVGASIALIRHIDGKALSGSLTGENRLRLTLAIHGQYIAGRGFGLLEVVGTGIKVRNCNRTVLVGRQLVLIDLDIRGFSPCHDAIQVKLRARQHGIIVARVLLRQRDRALALFSILILQSCLRGRVSFNRLHSHGRSRFVRHGHIVHFQGITSHLDIVLGEGYLSVHRHIRKRPSVHGRAVGSRGGRVGYREFSSSVIAVRDLEVIRQRCDAAEGLLHLHGNPGLLILVYQVHRRGPASGNGSRARKCAHSITGSNKRILFDASAGFRLGYGIAAGHKAADLQRDSCRDGMLI